MGAAAQPWKTPKTGASKRKTPDGGPTKPTSAYSAYSAEHREAYKKANPDKETGDVTKGLKLQWKELAADKKQPYLDKEAAEIKRYDEECKAAGIETTEEKKAKKDAEKAAKKAEKDAEKEKKKAEKVRDPWPSLFSVSLSLLRVVAGSVVQEEEKAKKRAEKQAEKEAKEKAKGPKRAVSSYMFYSSDVRPQFKEEYPDAQLGDLSKLMGAKWKTLSKEEKSPYEKSAKEDKVRYEKEKKEWEAEQAKAAAEAKAEAEAEAAKAAAQKEMEDKHNKALEAAAKLDGGDSSWFVKVLADAKQIESMAQVRKLHFLLPSNRPGEALTAPF